MNTIPDIAFACVLGLAALLAVLVARRARRSARDYLIFAAALYGALASADLIAALTGSVRFAAAVTLVIGALAPCTLTLALTASFARPPRAWLAAALLLIAACAGLFAAATGAVFVAFAPLFACLCAMLAVALRRARHAKTDALHATLAALALLAAAASFMTGADGRTSFALFSAAGLMGAALACASNHIVKDERARAGRPVAIGQPR